MACILDTNITNFAKTSFLILLPVYLVCTSRSSRLGVFCKKDVRRNFAKFKGKHLCQQLYLKRVFGTGVSCEFCEISKITFFNSTAPVAVSVHPYCAPK